MQIKKDTTIMAVLTAHPETRSVFAELGMDCYECLAVGHETIEDGARMHGLAVSTVLDALCKAVKSD